MRTISLLLCVLTISLVNAKRELPDYIVKCSKSLPQTELDECILQSVRLLVPYLVAGIPELKIPPIDPLIIPIVRLEAPRLTINMTNATIINVSKMDIKHFSVDLSKSSISMDYFVPSMNLSCQYNLKGMLIFELKGAGDSYGYLENVNAHVEMIGKSTEKNGKTYLTFKDNNNLKIRVKTIRMIFENLFERNPELTETTNRILNENMGDIQGDLLPFVEEIVGSYVFNVVNQIFSKFPIEELFLD